MDKRIVSIKGLDKADVLAALYNRAQTGGMGFLQYDHKPMTREEAQQLLKRTTYFDYLKGRSMKVDLSSDEEIDVIWYDNPSYNGEGSAEEAIEALRKTGDVNPAITQAAHHVGTLAAAEETKRQLHTESRWTNKGGIPVLHLGLAGVANVLSPAIDRAVGGKEEHRQENIERSRVGSSMKNSYIERLARKIMAEHGCVRERLRITMSASSWLPEIIRQHNWRATVVQIVLPDGTRIPGFTIDNQLNIIDPDPEEKLTK